MNETVSKIARDFKELAATNPKLAAMLKKLNSGKADYLDADRYALELATVLGKALHLNLGGEKLTGEDYQAVVREALPKGLYSIYEDVADYAQAIQQGINERQKVGLKATKPKFNQEESNAIADKAASADSYDGIPGGINQDMQHMAQNVATDTMKANAKLANDVGMEATVTRIYDGVGVHTQGTGKYRKECQWCKSRCGVNVPYSDAIANDMFRRHPGCGCEISYIVNGKQQIQTDWKHNVWEARQTPNKQEAIKKYEEAFEDAKTMEEAKAFAEKKFGIEVPGFEDMNLSVANKFNFEIQKAYDAFGNLHTKGVFDGLRVLKGRKGMDAVAAYSHPMKEIYLYKMNVAYKSSIGKMREMAVFHKSEGFWSTASDAHSIRHELGHAVRYTLSDSQYEKINAIRESIIAKTGVTDWSMDDTIEHRRAVGNYLSYYALKNTDEFIAEAVAEFMDGKPRKTASDVIKIIRGK